MAVYNGLDPLHEEISLKEKAMTVRFVKRIQRHERAYIKSPEAPRTPAVKNNSWRKLLVPTFDRASVCNTAQVAIAVAMLVELGNTVERSNTLLKSTRCVKPEMEC
jgi:hypothetical protein